MKEQLKRSLFHRGKSCGMGAVAAALLAQAFSQPFSAMAMEEKNLLPLYRILEELSPLRKPAQKEAFCMRGVFHAEGRPLAYIKCGKKIGRGGALIVVNGKEENILKYLELYYDFHLMGWGPVYSYDHRGQGFSQSLDFQNESKGDVFKPSPDNTADMDTGKTGRLAKTKKKPYYRFLKKDFEAFVRFVLKDLSGGRRPPLFVIAHSMGGAVLVDHLRENRHSPFRAVALSAPMIQIQAWLLPKGFRLASLRGFCFLFPCRWRIPSLRGGKTWEAFTHSRKRFDFTKHVIQLFPQARSQGTSPEWLMESFEWGKQLMDIRDAKNPVPLLILQSREDRLVSSESQNAFCEQFENCCRVETVPGRHEIFLEKDLFRDHAIQKTVDFFLQNGRQTTAGRKCPPSPL